MLKLYHKYSRQMVHWLPERKGRLVKLYKQQNGVLNFYIFRADMKQAWRIKDNLLTQDGLKEAKGRYITKGEKFFHIPYTDAELITLDKEAAWWLSGT